MSRSQSAAGLAFAPPPPSPQPTTPSYLVPCDLSTLLEQAAPDHAVNTLPLPCRFAPRGRGRGRFYAPY